MAEAETIVKADLPPDEAAAKVTALRQMLAKKKRAAGGQIARRCVTAERSRLMPYDLTLRPWPGSDRR